MTSPGYHRNTSTAHMEQSLTPDLEHLHVGDKEGTEDDDWVMLSPEIATDKKYAGGLQNAWQILLNSLYDQVPVLGPAAARGTCKCDGCVAVLSTIPGLLQDSKSNLDKPRNKAPALDLPCRQILLREEVILRDFQDIFEGFKDTTNTIDNDLSQISSRILFLQDINDVSHRLLGMTLRQDDPFDRRFILRSNQEFDAALAFFLGWFEIKIESRKSTIDYQLGKLCKLVETLHKYMRVAPCMKFVHGYSLQSTPAERAKAQYSTWSKTGWYGLIVATPSGTWHQINPDEPAIYEQKLAFEVPWQHTLAKCAGFKDEQQLRTLVFTIKHLACTMFDHGEHLRALCLLVQTFILESIFVNPGLDKTLTNLEQLGVFAMCCHQKIFMEHVLQRIEALKAPPYTIAADSKSADQFFTVLDYLKDPPDELSHILPESLTALKNCLEFENPIKRPSVFCCKLGRVLSKAYSATNDLEQAQSYLRGALSHLDICDEGESQLNEDEKVLEVITAEFDTGRIRSLLELDLAVILSKAGRKWQRDEAEALAQGAFRDFVQKARQRGKWLEVHHCRNELMNAGLTHWAFDRSAKAPFVINGTLGSGAYSIVNSVSWAGENRVEYAQKIYRVPVRSASKETYLKAINNEVEAIRKLKPDPHIVRIECTYTEEQTFVVVLSPRADEDLQSYLERQNHAIECSKEWRCQCSVHALAAMEPIQTGIHIRSWFYCLASALAAIHQQGVRHKDIKSRNILLKGSQLLYADFGSSRIFESELTSATTGTVNSGNTPMYSAPEVMQNQKRGRSADIFSLGCVFTEMLTVEGGKPLAEYHEFRKSAFIDQWGSSYETCAYHKTLGKVDKWFDAHPTKFPEYRAFIRPMLGVDRLQRPTAEATAMAIRNFYGDLASITCEACDATWKSKALHL